MWKKGEDSWVRWIKKRIDNNLNFLAIAEGPTGIGKSWALISIAHMIDPKFEPRQIAFDFGGVMNIINSDWFHKKKYKVLIFDEAQISIGNRSWHSLMNRLMNFLLSTFRHQNIILLFSSPYSDFLDSQSMKLMHAKFEIRGHNRKTNKTHIRPKLLQYNSKLKKFYEHSLYVIRDSKYNKMIHWLVSKPPMKLIKPYEEDKTEFTRKLNKEIERDLNRLEAQENEDDRRELTDKQLKCLVAMSKHAGDAKKAYEELGLGKTTFYFHLKQAKRKKYRWQEF